MRGVLWSGRRWRVLALAGLAVLGSVGRAPSGVAAVDLLPWSPYAVERVERYGDYIVCVWQSLDDAAPGFYRVVTIDRGEARLLCKDWVTGLGSLSGVDIDGSGCPNVVIEGYSGGAHCCFSTAVYDLADTLVLVDLPSSPGGNSPGEFVDLDEDGIYEFRTADDSFAYAYCAFAGSPAVLVILEYSAAQRRFVPASYGYPELYREAIRFDTERAKLATAEGAYEGWDGTPKCEVLPLILDYLYSGDPEAAWVALDAYYPFPDKDAFRAEIEAVVNASPYFAAPPG